MSGRGTDASVQTRGAVEYYPARPGEVLDGLSRESNRSSIGVGLLVGHIRIMTHGPERTPLIDAALVVRYTRHWLHYGTITFVVVCAVVGAIRGVAGQ